MAKPPAGYSRQIGAYFTADGQGPYSWDGTSMSLLGSGGTAAADIRTFDINGAGTYVLAMGPGALLEIYLSTSALSTPGLTAYDNTSASGPLVLAATNTPAGILVLPVGVPNVGSPFASALCLVVAGAQVGRVTVRLGS